MLSIIIEFVKSWRNYVYFSVPGSTCLFCFDIGITMHNLFSSDLPLFEKAVGSYLVNLDTKI